MIPLFASHIPEKAGDAVKELLKTGMVNRGKKAELFEILFRQMFGCGYALSVNNCTSALQLAVEIAKSRKGSLPKYPEIITTPYTMVATNIAILNAGCTPVFADIDYDTATLDPESIIQKVSSSTIGVMGVEYAGYSCNWEKIIDLLNRHYGVNEFTLISDSAHALGATHKHLPITEYVHAQCFSFGAIKHLTTGDGGILATNAFEIDVEARKRSWYGINKGTRLIDDLGARPLDIDIRGFKFTMNDIAATLGIEALKDFNRIFARRAEIANLYERELANVKGLKLMKYDRMENIHANWLFPIHVVNRPNFAHRMREKGIEVSVHNWRNDTYSLFGKHYWKQLELEDPLPNTEKLNSDLIHIPLHAELKNEEVDYIIKTIKELEWI